MGEVTPKYKTVRGKCSDDPVTMGRYWPDVQVIELFVDTIKYAARNWNCSYEDLKRMVILHEECHHKNSSLKLTSGQDEQLADQYAFWKFIKEAGRWPDVPKEMWFERRYV